MKRGVIFVISGMKMNFHQKQYLYFFYSTQYTEYWYSTGIQYWSIQYWSIQYWSIKVEYDHIRPTRLPETYRRKSAIFASMRARRDGASHVDQPGSCPLQNVPTKQYPVQVFSHLDLTLLPPPPPHMKSRGVKMCTQQLVVFVLLFQLSCVLLRM